MLMKSEISLLIIDINPPSESHNSHSAQSDLFHLKSFKLFIFLLLFFFLLYLFTHLKFAFNLAALYCNNSATVFSLPSYTFPLCERQCSCTHMFSHVHTHWPSLSCHLSWVFFLFICEGLYPRRQILMFCWVMLTYFIFLVLSTYCNVFLSVVCFIHFAKKNSSTKRSWFISTRCHRFYIVIIKTSSLMKTGPEFVPW